ncbi:hypothetical protein AB6G58_21765 [Providencia huaxiensis]
MPSRIGFKEIEGKQVLPQWPLAHFTVNAYNAEYAWKPDDNPWIDLNANIWMTHSVGDTNTSGVTLVNLKNVIGGLNTAMETVKTLILTVL